MASTTTSAAVRGTSVSTPRSVSMDETSTTTTTTTPTIASHRTSESGRGTSPTLALVPTGACTVTSIVPTSSTGL